MKTITYNKTIKIKSSIYTMFLVLPILLFSACSSKDIQTPSGNKALNKLTSANTARMKDEKKDGYLQKTLDRWLKEEWEPMFEAEKSVKNSNTAENDQSNLQKYVDKLVLYFKKKPSDENNSHLKKLNTMPVIGKSDKKNR